MALPVKVNYLTNKELLREIHKSKNSYCYFVDPKFSNYDAIIGDLNEITPELLKQTKETKAKKMLQVLKQEAKEQGLKNHQIKIDEIDPNSILDEDIVWRVMTHEHIPLESGRVKNPKNVADNHVRLIFPPFKHYVIEAGEAREVGRSHWKDALDNGMFSQDHGQTTKRLALMYMKLVERYSQKGNWRGYCLDTDTTALTKRGWLGINEITEDDEILSSNEGTLTWSKILDIYRGDYDGNMFKITNQSVDMLITPGHKLLTKNGLIKVDHLKQTDQPILMGEALNDKDEVHSNEFVKLAGWIFTEGNYDIKDDQIRRITIYQNSGENADEIRDLLNDLGYKFSEGLHSNSNLAFGISREHSREIFRILPNKSPSMEFMLELSHNQRQILFDTMIKGDGWNRPTGQVSYCQKDDKHMEMFQALCVMLGRRGTVRKKNIISYGKPTTINIINVMSKRKNTSRVESLDFHGGKRNGRQKPGQGKETHPNEPTIPYKGRVWCPVTEYGCFVARRNGTVYITGNSYVDEMRSQALLQLSMVGLQFNEARSDNPFAYYTVTVSNAFTRVLNLEKRNQNIRDDMLVMAGVAPSITRQIDNSVAQRTTANGEIPETKKPTRRGPPKKTTATKNDDWNDQDSSKIES